MDLGRIVYFINGVTFGVAFEDVFGPLYIGLSLYGNVQVTLITMKRQRTYSDLKGTKS